VGWGGIDQRWKVKPLSVGQHIQDATLVGDGYAAAASNAVSRVNKQTVLLGVNGLHLSCNLREKTDEKPSNKRAHSGFETLTLATTSATVVKESTLTVLVTLPGKLTVTDIGEPISMARTSARLGGDTRKASDLVFERSSRSKQSLALTKEDKEEEEK